MRKCAKAWKYVQNRVDKFEIQDVMVKEKMANRKPEKSQHTTVREKRIREYEKSSFIKVLRILGRGDLGCRTSFVKSKKLIESKCDVVVAVE